MKALICIAPDGEFVREGDFPDADTAWRRSEDMGSRWFFFPIHIVSGSKSLRSRIADVPHGVPEEWVGKTLGRFLDAIKSAPKEVCAYVCGEHPFDIYP